MCVGDRALGTTAHPTPSDQQLCAHHCRRIDETLRTTVATLVGSYTQALPGCPKQGPHCSMSPVMASYPHSKTKKTTTLRCPSSTCEGLQKSTHPLRRHHGCLPSHPSRCRTLESTKCFTDHMQTVSLNSHRPQLRVGLPGRSHDLGCGLLRSHHLPPHPPPPVQPQLLSVQPTGPICPPGPASTTTRPSTRGQGCRGQRSGNPLTTTTARRRHPTLGCRGNN